MRTTEYRYTVEGELEELVCRNGEVEEVTRWEYGTVLNEDGTGIARADLVRAKLYPDGGKVEYGHNRLSEVERMEDQNGTVHEYDYDRVARLRADRVTQVGDGIDEGVRAIRVSYLLRGEVEKVTSYDDPDAIAEENVVNEVLYAYNGFGQEVTEWQSHDGPAEPETTPGVGYGYEGGEQHGAARGCGLSQGECPDPSVHQRAG